MSLKGNLLLLSILLVLLLCTACQASVTQNELATFVSQTDRVEQSIQTAFELTEAILAERSQSGGEVATSHVRQLRDDVRDKRNELLLLAIPDGLHKLKLSFLKAADTAALALQYAAVYAETGDNAMYTSWVASRDLADSQLQAAADRLERLRR